MEDSRIVAQRFPVCNRNFLTCWDAFPKIGQPYAPMVYMNHEAIKQLVPEVKKVLPLSGCPFWAGGSRKSMPPCGKTGHCIFSYLGKSDHSNLNREKWFCK